LSIQLRSLLTVVDCAFLSFGSAIQRIEVLFKFFATRVDPHHIPELEIALGTGMISLPSLATYSTLLAFRRSEIGELVSANSYQMHIFASRTDGHSPPFSLSLRSIGCYGWIVTSFWFALLSACCLPARPPPLPGDS
jgi:hypothetical protein